MSAPECAAWVHMFGGSLIHEENCDCWKSKARELGG